MSEGNGEERKIPPLLVSRFFLQEKISNKNEIIAFTLF